MFALKPRAVRPIVGATLAVLTLGMANLTAAAEKVQIKQIGNLDSIIASRILTQVTVVPLDSLLRRGVPILLQGKTLKGMPQFLKDQVKASYLMGRTIVLLDATMSHVSALHALVGEGVTYRSKNSGTVMFYALRRENQIPTATLFTHVPFSPLLTASGTRDPYDVYEDPQAVHLSLGTLILILAPSAWLFFRAGLQPMRQAMAAATSAPATTSPLQAPGGRLGPLPSA